MRDRFQFCEGQEPGRALDGVDGAKDIRQDLAVGGMFLQFDQVAVEAVEVNVALD